LIAAGGYHLRMKLILAFAVWLIMAAILGAGLLLAVKGSPWLLVLGMLGFIVAVGKIGCSSH
jgi:hypothetical protein